MTGDGQAGEAVRATQRTGMWIRRTPLDSASPSAVKERWDLVDGGRRERSFEVDVRVGKPLDVLALKGTSLDEIREYARFLQATAAKLYHPNRETRKVVRCPCCRASVTPAVEAAAIFGVAYKRCGRCGHAFVGSQPDPEVLLEVFTESKGHATTYTKPEQVEFRLREVIKPKVDWMVETYRRRHGRDPRSVLDVGAGGGHFVEGCRRAGMRAEGYEVSRASRQFAKEVFDLELSDKDFLSPGRGPAQFDVVTFWGLLEYVPEPRRYLRAAHRRLNARGGLLVAEVPRFDCLGTAVQKLCPDTVARHLDPTSHVNCFSDASLVTALTTTGFRPVAAWYFGMDAYEVFVQVALLLGDGGVLERLAPLIPGLQACLDAARLCDDMIVAAVPHE